MRILISGYYGFGNAGDEAILAGLVSGLRAVVKDLELVVLSGYPGVTRRDHAVQALPRNLRVARRAIRQADLVISGGGGLLQDATSWRSPLYYLAIIWFALRARKRVAVIAHGIGPLRRRWIRRLTRRLLERVDLITVRDEVSRRALKEMDVAHPIHVTADPSFLLDPAPDYRLAEIWEAEGFVVGKQPTIGVCLRLTDDPPTEKWLSAVGYALDKLASDLGARLLFIPMQAPGDRAVSERVAQERGAAQVLQGSYAPRELLGIIGAMDLVIGMRLHSLIFAAQRGVPLVGLAYDPKVTGILAGLGVSALPLSGLTGEALLGAGWTAWAERVALRERLQSAAAAQREAAAKNISMVMELLTKS